MATLTIRNLPDDLRDRIRREAAEHGRSMEEEARRALADRFRPKRSPEEIKRMIDELHAKVPPLPPGAKMDRTDAFLASKRIDRLFEEGVIPLPEKQAWDEKIDNLTVSLPEVQAFFEKMWPWTPKS
jgi:plasmid stability protein